jgi:hypothetical protein
MSILIGSWEFEGPLFETQKLKAEPGIVALLTKEKDELELLELDESESVSDFVRRRIKSNAQPSVSATAVYYCGDLNTALRQGLVDELMKEFEDQDAECPASAAS